MPGAVHEDGTGRLQTINRKWNPAFHALLEHYLELTGVPLVINGSLNIMYSRKQHSLWGLPRHSPFSNLSTILPARV